jgi:hypothetical protein
MDECRRQMGVTYPENLIAQGTTFSGVIKSNSAKKSDAVSKKKSSASTPTTSTAIRRSSRK